MKLFPNIILFAITIALGYSLQAQVSVQNTGILFIAGPSNTLYINGSLTNASGSALTNNGNMYVTGNISNSQASMAAGSGVLYLNGSTQQQIIGTQVFRTNNLVTSNSAGILLNNDLSVAGAHTFTSGIISSSATPNYLIYEAGSSYSGDADSRHVNGWVRKTGTTAFSFPTGNGTVVRKIAVSNISSSTVFNARFAGATTNTGNVVSPLFTVDQNEYWQLNKVSGGSANVDMNWDNSKVSMPNYGIADIRVANYIGGNWTQVGGAASGNTSSTGAVSSNLISSFGAFTFGSVSVILPVQLLNFSARKSNTGVLLKWNTTNEVNVNHHEAQRSEDGLVFSKIGTVPGRNNAANEAYDFFDAKTLTATTYYRLRSVDNDGRSTLSEIVSVSPDQPVSAEITIVNPALKTIYGFTNTLTGIYQYQLNSLSGQIVQQGSVTISASGFSIPLSGSVNKGMYLLSLRKPGFNMVRKVIVEN
ncbi:T9SS type A sorting domain-containing protein [Flavitalea antarctica]